MNIDGVGVSPGVAAGRAIVAKQQARDIRYRIAQSAVDRERQRLRQARERAGVELGEIRDRVSRAAGPGHASLFEAQILMLDDPLFAGRAEELIKTERLNAEWAVRRASDELTKLFEASDDELLRERKGDLADVVGRVEKCLRPGGTELLQLVQELEPPLVIVADELPPSVAAQVDWSRVSGLAMDTGSPTHHTIILVRSLGVPAVAGLHAASQWIAPGSQVALDGTSGEVVLDPSPDVLAQWRAREADRTAAARALAPLRDHPATTLDGERVCLEANIELIEELTRVHESGAEGIGLYRSEFLLETHPAGALDEEQQYAIYSKLVSGMAPAPVTIRTFDAGEDLLRRLEGRQGRRRSRLGLRGIRLTLSEPEMFATQLRALLRASAHGKLRILLPFVSSVEEIEQARAALEQAAADVGIDPASVPLGAMIEVPSAALTADLLASAADFLSVGTNDLIQYTLAVDRTDDRVTDLYAPHHPAILRLLAAVARAARRQQCPVSVCGEMAADPATLGLLVGLGYRTFSMRPAAVPVAKDALGRISAAAARRSAREALRARDIGGVEAVIRRMEADTIGANHE
ncbi:MAG: phosphoenolpyruvate--protein phosphotransferase [Acidobacteriota bacterium]|nr:phosphoenolpyruvate--protein phosphotransferase [Acidobacteriota bacterium]